LAFHGFLPLPSPQQQNCKAVIEGEVAAHGCLSITRVGDVPTKAEEMVAPRSLRGEIWLRSGCSE